MLVYEWQQHYRRHSVHISEVPLGHLQCRDDLDSKWQVHFWLNYSASHIWLVW